MENKQQQQQQTNKQTNNSSSAVPNVRTKTGQSPLSLQSVTPQFT
jgi:hypothetical protein